MIGSVRALFIGAAIAGLAAAWAPAPAIATSTTPGEGRADLEALQKAAMTFPQSVRVGDLAGRYLLMPEEAQRVLGRVTAQAVARAPDGTLSILVRRGGFLGLGATTVAIRSERVALLGEHLVLVGLPPEALASLPALESPRDVVPPNETIRMGLVGPFH